MYTVGEYTFSNARECQEVLTMLVIERKFDLALQCQSILERLLKKPQTRRPGPQPLADSRQLSLFLG